MDVFTRIFPDCLRQTMARVEASEMSEIYDEALQQIQLTYSAPGYRKGKVPFANIEQQNPPQLTQHVARGCMSRLIDELNQQDIQLFSDPKFEALSDFARGEDFYFHITYECAPRVLQDLDLSQLCLSFEETIVDLDAVNASIQRQIQRFSESAQPVQTDDKVVVQIQDPSLEAPLNERTLFAKEAPVLLGKAKGEEVQASLEDLAPYAAAFLNLQPPISLTITQVLSPTPVDKLTDADVQQSSHASSLSDLRSQIQQNLEQFAIQLNLEQKKLALSAYIGRELQVELPKSVFLDASVQYWSRWMRDQLAKPELPLLPTLQKFQEQAQNLPMDAYQSLAYLIYLDHYAAIHHLQADEHQVHHVLSAYARQKNTSVEEFRRKASREELSWASRDALREHTAHTLMTQIQFQAESQKPISALQS